MRMTMSLVTRLLSLILGHEIFEDGIEVEECLCFHLGLTLSEKNNLYHSLEVKPRLYIVRWQRLDSLQINKIVRTICCYVVPL